ncbi:DNA polymerase-like [Apium graveolens]|uniref:DNA polymerase-like n=1 Tax=Apium graveolens TaxID=4045 RepID=UPI003D794371
MVADIETILILDDKGLEVQTPYAASLLVVLPEKVLDKADIMTFYSEGYIYQKMYSSFKERSDKILYEMVKRIHLVVNKQVKNAQSIYFHNLSRFDGIILLKHLLNHHPYYVCKPPIRNHQIYEIKVYNKMQNMVDEKMVAKKGVLLFTFKDSLNLLPGKQATLAQNLCPDLGDKYVINHEQLKTVEDIFLREKELLEYLKQDVLLLGGVMKKAQEIIFNLYNVNINTVLTVSSLAMRIFRIKYYDASSFPIHIPNVNEDNFIKRGYYGGHVDVYKSYGEKLFYYDVNSLYPYVMQKEPMPAGKPVWNIDLKNKDLGTLYGFIEAYVECPDSLNKPFLPYRDLETGSLLFPTGHFVGVYYSEELKYARTLGYKVYPLRGYLFKKVESPFKTFVNDIYNSSLEAKKDGNEGMSYVYKILMNSLYGRFGINPKMTITEICDQDRYNQILRMDAFINGDTLNEDTHVVNFIKDLSTDGWEPPKNAAVQIAVAITACARIYMYPHISREDCYYTDTDSIVLGNPLSDEWISSSVLGKFKLEDQIASGVFLAPKSYCYITIDGQDVIKHKGPEKQFIDVNWFKNQRANIKNKQSISYSTPFGVNWNKLQVVKKTTNLAMNVEPGAKRQAVYTEKNVWLDTKPKKVDDLKDCTNQDLKYIIQILFKNNDSNESLNTTLETYQSDVDRESDRSGIHSDGYGSESYDNSSGNDSDSGSDNKNEIIPPIDDKEDETTNTSDNHSSTSSGWDKVVKELRREREERKKREATDSTSTCEPTSTYASTANDYTTARKVDDYSQHDTYGENELIQHYVIRMQNKDRVKEIWDRKAKAEKMLSKLNSDDVVNPRTINYWKDEIRCVNQAYTIFKTQKDIREGKTTVEDITLSNWYAGDYSADIPYPYDPDVKILLDKFKDKEKAQHVWLWKEKTHMELKREAEKGNNADLKLLMLYKYRIACVKVAYSKYMDSRKMDGDKRLESLADFLPSYDSVDYESNASYYDSTSYHDYESNASYYDSTSYSTYDSLNKPTDVKDGNNDAVRTSLDQSDDSSGYGYGSSDESDGSSDDKTTSEMTDGTTSSGGNDSNNHNSNDSHNKEPFSRIKDLDDP